MRNKFPWRILLGALLILFGSYLVFNFSIEVLLILSLVIVAVSIIISKLEWKKVKLYGLHESDDPDEIRCPSCHKIIGNRWQIRESLGPFKPTASIGGSARCPHCGSSIYLSL